MTDVWSASTAGTDTVWRTGLRAKLLTVVLAFCLGVGAVFGATLLVSSAPAAASQVTSLQAQAAQLSRQMVLEQLQIGAYQQQYDAALQRAQADRQLLAQVRDQVDRTQRRIGTDLARLSREAVRAYIDAGTQSGSANPLFGNTKTAGARAVYDRVVTGHLSLTLDQLRSDRHTLKAQQAKAQATKAQDVAAETQAGTLLQKAHSTQQALQDQSAQVNGQLAAAVAQQQAQQAAAAAAALAAARARAAAQASAAQRAAAAPAAGPSGSSTALPTLNPFLRCVVQAESGGNYQAVSPTGQYMGAFQFSQPTWNEAAQLAGMPYLIGVPPNQATPAQQDALAIALYAADGQQPWYDPCRTG